MQRPAHEFKPGEEPEGSEAPAEEAPVRKFPGFPLVRRGPERGKRVYPNPRRQAVASEEGEQESTPSVDPAEQRARREAHLRARGLLGDIVSEEPEAPEATAEPEVAPTPTTPSPPPPSAPPSRPADPEIPKAEDPENPTNSDVV